MKKPEPTPEMYAELQAAYRHFNDALFAGQLPECLITLQRKKSTMGYFSQERFVRHDRTLTDEIALNPEFFAVCGVKEIMQTIVHEMAHLWQHHFGQPGRGRYHNREWADKMESLGLMPSDTGQPGGKRTGDHMADYVIEGGPFDLAATDLFTRSFRVSWYDRFPAGEPGSESGVADMMESASGETATAPKGQKLKYRCPRCDVQVWGKPGLRLICGEPECHQAAMPPVL